MQRATKPPNEGEREAPFALRTDGDGWTIDGYAAVFNRETVIDSQEGRFREQIAPGSMVKSFRENPPKVQYDHGHHPLIGSFPIATVERVAEEVDPVLAPDGGAHVVARMIPHLFFEPIREAIAGGAINGMSFRFSVLREAWHTPDGQSIDDERSLQDWLTRSWRDNLAVNELPLRTLKELRVPELGPVAWPAYDDTSVGVRSTIIDLAALPKDPGQRMLFAKTMWAMPRLVDSDKDAPRSTATDCVAAAEHPSDDAPPDTTVTTPVAVEHPSPSTRDVRAIDLVLRNQRDTLLTIKGMHNVRTHRGTAHRADPHPQPVGETAGRNLRTHGRTRRAG